MENDVPLLVPEINPEHLNLIPLQKQNRNWPGYIVTNPNCSTIVLTMAIAPLCQFGLKAVNVTTLQAVSGAGYPGVSSYDIVGNVIPYIAGEEEKMENADPLSHRSVRFTVKRTKNKSTKNFKKLKRTTKTEN